MVQIVQVVAFDTVIVFLLLILPSIIFVAGSSSFTSTEQVEALLNWKSTLVTQTASSFLPSWKRDFGAVSPCNWSGITCSNKGSVIVGLNLTGLGLQGTLLGFNFSCFANLVSLVLSNNKLFGFIPPQISNLISLIHLDLSQNELSGFIPEEIGSLSSLTTLALYTNKLNGSIPSSVWNLRNLIKLVLFGNRLTGELPTELSNLTQMLVLTLANNSLSGTVPASIGQCSSLTFLHLGRNNFTGNVPKEIAAAGKLRFLQLNNNNFDGTLSDFISKLQYLEVVNLANNKFGGSIPLELGSLRGLQILSLRLNNFYGSIPEEIMQLPQLRILDLSLNNLTGVIPSTIGNLEKLISRLNHTVVTDDYYNFRSVQLRMNIKGITVQLAMLYSYTSAIDLSCNSLEGSIPEEIVSLKGLYMLNLSYNYFSGNIPANIGDMSGLESLDLCYNRFSGNIPQSLTSMDSLGFLNLSYNKLSGRIPEGTHFETLSWDGSIFTGNGLLCGVPTEKVCKGDQNISLINEVEEYDLEDANDRLLFYVALATGIGVGFGGLFILLLKKDKWWSGYWKFVDSIAVRIIILLCCDGASRGNTGAAGMAGVITLWQWQSSSFFFLVRNEAIKMVQVNQVVAVFVFFFVGFFFEYIFVSGGSLFTSTHTQQDEQVEALLNWKSTLVSQTSSLLPSWKRENSTTTSVLNPCKWSGITCNDEESVVELNMTGLGLQGTLDGFNFSCFTNFVSLDLSSNKFSGFIPQQIGNISKLTHLDFSQNEFSGFIPEEIGRLSSLTTLALYTNKLNGSIPTSLYDLRNLTKLLLFGNRLTGSLQTELSNLTQLRVLALANNSLSGNIPPSIGKCSSLIFLHLGRNNFSGNVPSELGTLGELRYLQLNNNNLNGSLSSFIGKLQYLRVINLANNKFGGSIPVELVLIRGIQILSLRSNNFIGSIPEEITQLHQLRILDLSCNNLTGIIPSNIGNLEKLTTRLNDTVVTDDYYNFRSVQLKMDIKGITVQLAMLYSYTSAIDLSCNNLEGSIPKEIVLLKGLFMLNLSYNHFSGSIPANIGDMSGLESLDLCYNELSGNIPQSLTSMDSLGFLNLSYNKLSGRIPEGTHFETLSWDGSIFTGNDLLCGVPTEKICEGDQNISSTNEVEDYDQENANELCIAVATGIGVGIWGLFFLLLIKKEKWWSGYWKFVDSIAVRTIRCFHKT
ncbi:LRR receptor-like serine/threonine-protein kinase GSO1 [Papaver somniferum]|uniref:LRR receptor-like serine/threonine-protein kinase GSO1 n=1 Tax=Papaver somniferum TaxID=3469 RepID=UPI000E70443B|nr:LRR receptor-like serine/threonine-protein kinase GSO1 [Papaver somniferum]